MPRIRGRICAAVNNITPGGGGISGRLYNTRNLFTGSDDVQLVRGKHQLSFGAWVQRIQVNANSAARNYGEADFASLLTFLQGTTTNWVGVPNRTFMYWRSTHGAWYVQDVMQLRPNLTVRAGLRDEFTNGWNEKYGRAAQYVLNADGVPTSDPVTSSTHIGKSTFSDNKATRLLSPRVSFAWDVFGNGKTSMRSGFGMYYSLLDNLSFQMNFTAPYNVLFAFNNLSLYDSPLPPPVVPGSALPPFCSPANPPGVPGAPCTAVQAQGVQLNAKTPTVVSWNYSIEQQLIRNMSLRVAYVGSHGYHNIIDIDANTIPQQTCNNPAGCASGGIRSPIPSSQSVLPSCGPGIPAPCTVPQGTPYFPAGTRPNRYLANAYFWYTEGIGSYNSLQADLTKRLSSGLLFRVNYTFAKNLDNGTATASSQSQNNNQAVLDGPGLAEIDISVFKTIPITERTRLLFRAEAFNIANRPNFGIPNFLIFSGESISPSAGQITSTVTSSRQIQFGLKLMF